MSSSSQNNWEKKAKEQQEDPAYPWETWALGHCPWRRAACFPSLAPAPALGRFLASLGRESGSQHRSQGRVRDLGAGACPAPGQPVSLPSPSLVFLV